VQFLAGLTTGIYIGTHYDCKPILKIMISTFNQYCPKKELTDESTKEPVKAPVKACSQGKK
jgi:hypothetical protein